MQVGLFTFSQYPFERVLKPCSTKRKRLYFPVITQVVAKGTYNTENMADTPSTFQTQQLFPREF